MPGQTSWVGGRSLFWLTQSGQSLLNRFVSSSEWLLLLTLLARLLRSVRKSIRPSVTWQRLAEMLSYLPSRQYRGLWFLLGISTAVGLADLVFVGLIARLVGSFSGSSLVDNLPFVRVFGGDALDLSLIHI